MIPARGMQGKKKTNISCLEKTCLPEEAKKTQNWKEDFPEEHDLPQIVEMEQLANSSQGLKKFFKKGFKRKFEPGLAPKKDVYV